MQFPIFLNPLVSLTHAATLQLSHLCPRFNGVDSKINIALGTHPMADLYMATSENYKSLKKFVKEESPRDHEDLKKIKHNKECQIKNKVERTKAAIHQLVLNRFNALSQLEKNNLYGTIYSMAKPQTDDPQWGENHAFDDLPEPLTPCSLQV